MRLARAAAAALLLSATALPAATLPPLDTKGVDPKALAQLKADMQGLVASKDRAGIAYGVMLKGKLVALEGMGVRNRATNQPMDPDTIVRLFSMSRAVTTVAFLTLVDEGKVKLDDPVSKYIPAFANTPVLKDPNGSTRETVPQDRPMTIRTLLDYSSGLGYTQAYPDAWGIKQTEVMGPGVTTADGIEKIAHLPLFAQPGTRWRYGFSGDVIGRIAEIVSGEPLDKFLHERLFDKIGMNDTEFWVRPAKIDRLAKAYGPVGDDKLADVNHIWQPEYGTFDKPISFLSAGGGLASTTKDYLRFLQMLVNGGTIDGVRILKPETVAEMTTGHVQLAPGTSYRPHMKFGYGLGVLDPDGERPFGLKTHEATWGGLADTVFYIDPDHGLAAVGMTQYFGPDADKFTSLFRTDVFRLLVKP